MLEHNLDLSDSEKIIIKNIYNSWKHCTDNRIFLENIKNSNIRINNDIVINNINQHKEIDDKSSLFFTNCQNINITINTKISHLTLESCENINLRTRGGIISGLDNINCKHINNILEQSCVYFIDVSKSQDCLFYIQENLALDTIISTYASFATKIITTDQNNGIKNKYGPIISFFDIHRLYIFENNGDKLNLYFVSLPTNTKSLVNKN